MPRLNFNAAKLKAAAKHVELLRAREEKKDVVCRMSERQMRDVAAKRAADGKINEHGMEVENE